MANTFNHNDKVVITDGGSVGIGTTGPSEKLEINGNILVDKGDGGRILIKNGSQSILGLGDLGGGTDGQVAVYNDSGTLTNLINGGTSATYFNSGNVGIGTTAPQTKLHLTGAITISDVGGTDDVTLIQFTETNNYDQFSIRGDFAGAGGENKLKFSTDLGGGDILTMKGDGNVGIGTTSPGYLLEAAGTIRATGTSSAVGVSGAGVELRYTAGFGSVLSYNRGSAAYEVLRLEGSAISLREDGSDVLYVTGGNVGIGTTSPSYKLHVRSTESALIQIEGTTASNYTAIRYLGTGRTWSQGIGNGSETALGLANKFYLYDATVAATRLVVDTNGNVGIGTTSPDVRLHVNEAGTVNNQTIVLGLSSRSLRPTIQFSESDGAAAGNGMSIEYDGRGSGVTNKLYINGVDNVAKLTVESGGNVGIGTTSPADKLHVVGDVRVSGNLDLGHGSAGEYSLEIGQGRTGNGYAYIDLVGDETYTDYGFRFIRYNNGANASSAILHKGTGNLIIKTENAGGLSLETNNSSRLFINSSGNVGIGTTSPEAKLHISSSTNPASGAVMSDSKLVISGADGNMDLLSTDDNSTVSNNIGFGRYNSSTGALIHKFGITSWANTGSQGSNTGSRLAFNYGTAANVWDNTELMSITSGGNVGIGTSTPAVNLHIHTTGSEYAYTMYSNDATGSTIANGSLVGIGRSEDLLLWNYEATPILFATSGSEKMRITSAGNVGIGTTSPQTSLQVGGTSGSNFITLSGASTNGEYGINWAFNAPGTNIYSQIKHNWNDRDTKGLQFNTQAGYRFSFNAINGTGTFQSNLVTVLGSGNVGIGTTSPLEKLDITDGKLRFTNTISGRSSTIGMDNSYDFYIKNTPLGNLYLGNGTTTYIQGHLNVDNGVLYVNQSTNNVGIGTTSPDSKLSVQSTSSAIFRMIRNQNLFGFEASGNSSGGYGLYDYQSNDYDIFFKSGNVGIGTTSPQSVLHISAPKPTYTDSAVVFRGGTTNNNSHTGITLTSAGDALTGGVGSNYLVDGTSVSQSNSNRSTGYLRFANTTTAGKTSTVDIGGFVKGTTTDVSRLFIDGDGQVGIGTTSPAYKLDVSGDIRSTAAVRANTNLVVGGYTDITGVINHRSDIRVLNKAATNWITWAARDTSGSESVINLSNIGTFSAASLDVSGDIKTSGIVYVSATASTALRPAANDWIDIAEMGYGEHNGKIAFEWNGLSAPSSAHHGWFEIEVGTYYSASFNYGQDTYVEVTKALAHNDFWLSAVRAVDYGSTVRIQVQVGRAVTAGTFRSFVLHKNQGTVTSLTPAINNNSYTVLALANVGEVDGDYVQKAIGNRARFSKSVAFDDKVGIGTTSPRAKLDVSGDIYQGWSDAWNFVGQVYQDGASYRNGIATNSGSRTTQIEARSAGADGEITFLVGTSEVARMVHGGDVGIGTTSPGAKLEVNGSFNIVNNQGLITHFNYAYTSTNYIRGLTYFDSAATYFTGGNVGIGTTSPSGLLHVNKQTGVTSFTSSTFLQTVLSEPNGQGAEYVGIDFTGYSNIYIGKPLARIAVLPTGNGTVMSFGTSNSYSTGVTNQAMIINYDGNVGIGTTSPVTGLDVRTAGYSNTTARFGSTRPVYIVNGDPIIGFNQYYNNGWAAGTSGFSGNVGLNSSGDIYFNTSTASVAANEAVTNSTKVTILNGGNVGIGTTSPGAKLHVEGTVVATGGIVSLATSYPSSANIWGISNDYPATAYGITYVEGSPDEIRIQGNSITNHRFGMDVGNAYLAINSGSVGIGTTSPDEKLHVGGNLKVVGSIYAEPSITINGSTDDTKQLLFKTGDIERWNFYTDGAEPGVEVGSDLKLARYYDNGTSIEDVLTIKRNNGYIGIGTNPSYRLDVNGSFRASSIYTDRYIYDSGDTNTYLDWVTGDQFRIVCGGVEMWRWVEGTNDYSYTSYNVGIGATTAPSYQLDVTGTIRATGDVIAYSDARVKENVETIPNALETVKSMRGVGYNKIGEEKRSIGVIAQELLEVLPEAVHQDESGMYSVAYGNIVGVLVEAIKEQQNQIDELKAKLDGLTK